ncbi:MAG: NAD(P)/FAD-dependent oxidoreductase [Pseudomonadota bacterium]
MTADHIEDVVIVGAGLSGVGAASRLRIHLPHLSVRIFESRERMGGTWDLFRYPGIRSDSDMYTLGYPFRPWHLPKSLTDAQSIKGYIEDTAREYGVDKKITYGARVVEIAFCSKEALWTSKIRYANGQEEYVRSRFLFACCGYYDYETGHVPMMGGEENFRGQIIEPQFWPEGLDYTCKKVVVIGSGATAVTIVPAMAEKAAHVTMLQRSPTYIVSMPAKDPWFDLVRAVLPAKAAFKALRIKRIMLSMLSYQLSRRVPNYLKSELAKAVRKEIGDSTAIDPHFTPDYNPWDQRLCLVPDNDLFHAIRDGHASIETDHIETFTEHGVMLKSGKELEADIVIKATGLKLLPLGGIDMSIDGKKADFENTFVYKGSMLSGFPNFVTLFGYTNASWTLKTDLACRYVCRLIKLMERKGSDIIVPEVAGAPPDPRPAIDLQSGYVTRGIDLFPRQGTERPWRNHQNYVMDYIDTKFAKLDDGIMQFKKRTERPVILEAAE